MEDLFERSTGTRTEPIAIIGSACRFPGACNTPSKLWDLLQDPRDVLSPIPEDRFSAGGFYHNDGQYHGHSNVKSSYFLSENVREFDANFFGIKPVEANATDPQQRLLLETVYESIESAGLVVESLRGSKTAVYVGLMCGDYDTMIARDTDGIPTYHATGTARSMISNRVSYFFDWQGPSMTIDTACSSSLVAIHQAVQVLRSGDSSIAVAAGSNLILGPEHYIAESKLKMLSPDSRSRMWDADANGYARGEGVASVVLKTLSAALKDGDHIECIIRETGINQDGRTNGITSPSAAAQASLIKETYSKAGLNYQRREDQCQYFEAHGTGTPAGDPVEAEAICRAFFPSKNSTSEDTVIDQDSSLYVGSIKTIIGHTEGTAGIAAILKASLALQHSVIPPNMLFNKLNPAIEPFYDNLTVPTVAIPWPAVSLNSPRRASVNSFGFGGANAHAILESYESPEAHIKRDLEGATEYSRAFNFSAKTESSLTSILTSYSYFLQSYPTLSPDELAYTLSSRRSSWPLKVSFAARGASDLQTKLNNHLNVDRSSMESKVGILSHPISKSKMPAILGVFTGQGAQWAGMGRGLLIASEFARTKIFQLDRWLAELPIAHRPTWSIQKELMTSSETSRLMEAEFSQPLCTAVQLLLVDTIHALGLSFQAVVGHSSGEIGAAYAAGFISARDAIYIAYYRGYILKGSKTSGVQDSVAGAMLAVETSLEDAENICELPYFRNRITIAASNSPTSMTLSGNRDQILQASLVFQDENKFNRLLKVDRAYHSPHMLSFAKPYEQALKDCGITGFGDMVPRCPWYSSVSSEKIDPLDPTIGDNYWARNLTQRVRFREAVEAAYEMEGPFDIALEIGPHPALKGQVSQIISKVAGVSMPYIGLLRRGLDDSEALSGALGLIWSHFPSLVDFVRYERLMTGISRRSSLLKGLPLYAWDHDREFWHEGRQSARFRSRTSPHPLLGHLSSDSTKQYCCWRNVLSTNEVPWLQDHKLQGQIVFPAAGYIVLALEAAVKLADNRQMESVEVCDLSIVQALTFNENEAGTETIFAITDILWHGETRFQGSFMYHCQSGKVQQDMTLLATGKLEFVLGDGNSPILPSRSPPEMNLIGIETDQFYSALLPLGYEYNGCFRALSSMKRTLGWASGHVSSPSAPSDGGLILHPGMLDAAIQSVLLAYSYPEDGRLSSLHVPTTIRRVTLDVARHSHSTSLGSISFFETNLSHRENHIAVTGDVELYPADGGNSFLLIEGITCEPFAAATAHDDRRLFSQEVWTMAVPDAIKASLDRHATEKDYELAEALERASYFYMRQIQREVHPNDPARSVAPYKGFFSFIDHTISNAPDTQHPFIKLDWKDDTIDDIMSLQKRFGNQLDFQMITAVGEQFKRVIRGETTILEHLMKGDLLYRYYKSGLGFSEHTNYLARIVGQIVNRFPQMEILEIGAGTGATTKHVLDNIGSTFSSYTYTDISQGFFEAAKSIFTEYDKIIYRTLNIEEDVDTQGFSDESFDLIVASNVLHATAVLERTLRHVRRLLRPGGYLVMLEITDNGPVRSSFVFGSLPGWWLGVDDGRTTSPLVSTAQWDILLRNTGFSGVDTVTPDDHRLPYPGSVIVSHAVDNKIRFLDQPLLAKRDGAGSECLADHLIIIGGFAKGTEALAENVNGLLSVFFGDVVRIESVRELKQLEVQTSTAILSLTELDCPLFKDLTPEVFAGFKSMFDYAEMILWVTAGCRDEQPYSNMTVGFGRSQQLEIPELRLQFLDIGESGSICPEILADALLRFCASSKWFGKSSQNYVWSTEPELIWEQNHYMISRLVETKVQNDRYNSARRRIQKEVCPLSNRLVLEKDNSIYLEQERSTFSKPDDWLESCLSLRSRLSTLSPIYSDSAGRKFLVLGIDEKSGDQFIFLSSRNASINGISEKDAFFCAVPYDSQAKYLVYCSYNLLALSTLAKVALGKSLLVLDPGPLIATIFRRRAAENNISVEFLNVSATQSDGPWTQIYSHSPIRQIRRILPKQGCLFIDFSTTLASKKVARTIRNLLQETNDLKSPASTYKTMCHSHEFVNETTSTRELLRSAMRHSVDDLSIGTVLKISEHTLSELPDFQNPGNLEAVIRWDDPGKVHVPLRPVDSSPLFQSDRTYWLVGLTGTLSLSLCEWMIGSGARYVALSSRNPKVDNKWIRMMAGLGATVKIFSNDIVDKAEVEKLYHNICQNMPPLAGVAHGAMVLRDSLSSEMSLDGLLSVTRPKVDGSIILDQILSDVPLDFFILFSSMASIVGNVGQCNYTAANAFLASLSNKRRKKGLPSSVINIGAVLGVGYVTEQLNPIFREKLREGGHTWLSEQDFHQIFAEGVIASNPANVGSSQISTGLRYAMINERDKPTWFNNPKFGHQIITESTADTPAKKGTTTSSNIQDKLSKATSHEELYQIITFEFFNKMQSVLQLGTSVMLKAESYLDRYPNELGIDSLIAVDLRTWFMKNLSVNMPVLKIVGGGSSIRDLIDYTVANLPPALALGDQVKPTSTNGLMALPTDDNHNREDNQIPHRGVGLLTEASESDTKPSNESESYPLSDSGDALSSISCSTSSKRSTNSTDLDCLTGDMSTSISMSNHFLIRQNFVKQFPLSYSQLMFWLATKYVDDPTALNHTGAYTLKGSIRIDQLERALRTVANRHEILRTCFLTDRNNDPIQGVMQYSSLRLESRQAKDEKELSAEITSMKKHIFKLDEGNTMRITLLSQTEIDHCLIIGCHPLVADGTSHQVFMAELEHAYDGKSVPRAFQYSEIPGCQIDQGHNLKWKTSLEYWKQEFSTLPAPLPPIYSSRTMRPATRSYSVHRVDFRLNMEFNDHIRSSSRHSRVTPFHFYLAVFQVLLTRSAGTDDISIGMAEANRINGIPEDTSALGPYVNLLPLRFGVEEDQTFAATLEQTRQKVILALKHSAPYQVLLDELRVHRHASHDPLFQAFIDYRQGAKEKQKFSDCELEVLDFDAGGNGYDISLDIIDNPGGDCLLMLMVQKSLYEPEVARLLLSSYVNLLSNFSKDSSVPVNQPGLFSPEDRKAAIAVGTGQIHVSQWPATIIHRIEDITATYNVEPAVKDGDGTLLSYGQLATRVQSIASELVISGIGESSVVVIYQEPTVDWICSLLAVLRVGAAYLPIEPSTPVQRLEKISLDCRVIGIVIHDYTQSTWQDIKDGPLKHLKVINVSTTPAATSFVPISTRANAPATILHTSGSTGDPKGIILTNSNLRNEAEFSASTYLIKRERVLQQSSIAFDMSLTHVFSALAYGGMIYVVPRALRVDPVVIARIIVDEEITLTSATPSEYTSWITSDTVKNLHKSPLRLALVGGEHFSSGLVQKFESLGKPELRIFNGYGPTETTCSASRMQLSHDEESDFRALDAGRPAPNCSIYILDQYRVPVAIGVPGEIFISGAGVAAGYVDIAGVKTPHHSFVPDPFARPEFLAQGWNRMYRTGDMGQWLHDGSLRILGRISGDTQVKLRGLRIELQDLENTILSIGGDAIVETVASVRKSEADQSEFIVAHVVLFPLFPKASVEGLLSTLKSHLPLPQYMYPSMVIPVSELPRNVNGKLDRKAVAALKLPDRPQGPFTTEKLSKNESELLNIWNGILPQMTRSSSLLEASFFDVGGNSLLLLKLQASIRRSFGVLVPLAMLFGNPYLGGMSRNIHNRIKDQSFEEESEDIKWENESAIPQDIWEIQPTPEEQPTVKPGVVVLTGSTGFLGRALLRHLLEDENIKKIHCVAVRNQHKLLEFADDSRVVVHLGELALPMVGLTVNIATEVFREADVMIHNGADVSHLKAFRTLREANLRSTQELVKLCLPRRIPFHYVSTAGVALLSNLDCFGESSIAPYHDQLSRSDGYTASKWCSERFLEKMSDQFQLKICIHRPSSILREGNPGLDLLQNLLKYIRLTQHIPQASNLRGSFDIVYLDTVTRGICQSLKSGVDELITYKNHSGDVLVPFETLKDSFSKEHGTEYQYLPMNDWITMSKLVGMDSLVGEVFETVEKGTPIVFPRLETKTLKAP